MEKEAMAPGATIAAATMEISAQNFAARDLQVITYNKNTDDFSELSLKQYAAEYYTVPVFTNDVMGRLRSWNVVLLTGSYGFDKESFARHLAHCMSQQDGRTAYGWSLADGKAPDVARHLLENEKPSVYILGRVGPKELNFDLEKIRTQAKAKGHYVVITSELALSTWQLPDLLQRNVSFEIPVTGLYDQQVITSVLLSRLQSNKQHLPPGIDADACHENTALTDKHTIAALVTKLNTPEQASFLVETICQEKSRLTSGRLEEIMLSLSDSSSSLIGNWFMNLNEHEKMIALAAALFDGLYEDQFFDLMQEVAKTFWQYRNPGLFALDYADIGFVMLFFKLEQSNAITSTFKGKFPNQRADLIRACWSTHRRHILEALPVMVRVGQQSRNKTYSNENLYNSRARRMRLRTVIAELLSDIGMVSLPAVEERLVAFAASSDKSLQLVTAKGIARWRSYGCEAQLFDLVSRWMTDEKLYRQIANVLAAEEETDEQDNPETAADAADKARAYLKTTGITALKHAAAYDRPGQLHEEIISLLATAAAEEIPVVDTQLSDVLPELIACHYSQLETVLPHQFMIYPRINDAVVEGICAAYDENPAAITAMLERWMNACMVQTSLDNRRKAATYRDHVVITLLKVYRRIPYTHETLIRPADAWQVLDRLAGEERAVVREEMLRMIGFLITLQPDHGLPRLQPIFNKATMEERVAMLSSISEVYIEQRRHLTGNKYKVMIRDEWFPGFGDQSRPLTKIEVMMQDWINGSDVFAQQLALLALTRFAQEFDSIEKQQKPTPLTTSSYTSTAQTNRQEYSPSRNVPISVELVEPELSIWNQILTWCWLWFKTPEEKIMLRRLMKTLILYKPVMKHADLKHVTLALKYLPFAQGRMIGTWVGRLIGRVI